MSDTRFALGADSCRHVGLFLDKYLPGREPERQDRVDPQHEALQRLAGKRLDQTVYTMAFKRWRSLWEGPNILRAVGTVRQRVAIGLGAGGPLENGIMLHHTYGTPLIRGSSLKGLLRHSMPAEHRNKEREDKKHYEWYLFGENNHEGSLSIQDAWWIPDATPPLLIDVITPHHQQYLEQRGAVAPTDSDSPIPVPFVTVRGSFLFVIECPNDSWREYTGALLKASLQQHGIGGKRAAGYGLIDLR